MATAGVVETAELADLAWGKGYSANCIRCLPFVLHY